MSAILAILLTLLMVLAEGAQRMRDALAQFPAMIMPTLLGLQFCCIRVGATGSIHIGICHKVEKIVVTSKARQVFKNRGFIDVFFAVKKGYAIVVNERETFDASLFEVHKHIGLVKIVMKHSKAMEMGHKRGKIDSQAFIEGFCQVEGS